MSKSREEFFRTEWTGWRLFNLAAELILVMAALGGAAPPPSTILHAQSPPAVVGAQGPVQSHGVAAGYAAPADQSHGP